MENIISLLVFASLFVVGYIAGTINEKRHYSSIKQREKALLALPALTMKNVIDEQSVIRSEMVSESVVISIDYFKRILALLKGLVGGSIGPYETLVDRARREAVLRLKESAPDAAMIINVRVETSIIGESANTRGNVGSVEALAYGTAIWQKSHAGD